MTREAVDAPLVGRRIADARRARGWTRDELARRTGLSRTTLHHLENGETERPREETLARLADVLGLEAVELHALVDRPSSPVAECDRQTNTEIAAVFAESPGLFGRWTRDEWEELYSTFGAGGRLNEAGVRHEAERINRRRETIDRLRVVLDTHLADVAERMIGTLFDMVSLDTPPPPVGTPEPSDDTRSRE